MKKRFKYFSKGACNLDRKNDRKVTKFDNFICWVFLSPVSPVFHTVVTVRIHLKTQLEWEQSFHRVRCPC